MPADTPQDHAGHSRRLFLGQVGLWCAVGLSGCREEPELATPTPTPPQPLPELPTVADVPHAPLPGGEPTVRVLVHRDRTGQPDLVIGGGAAVMMISAGGETLLSAGPIRLDAQQDAWRVLLKDSDRLLGVSETLDIEPMPPAERIDLDGVAYPGALTVHRRVGDTGAIRIDVVNHVRLEAYLPGVVGRELYSHWHETTHRAQAIAARSFACAEHAYFSTRRHYDLTAGQRSQAYAPEMASKKSRRSVEDTRGRVLSHDGRLVPGYYCACCGGTAATATDAIGPHPFNTILPLRGRSAADHCSEAPLFRWSIDRSLPDTLARLQAYGEARRIDGLRTATTLVSVTPCSHNAFGRPTEYAVDVGQDEPVVLSADDTRRAIDATASGLRRPRTRLWSSSFDVAIDADALVIRGAGHGHGVGLCQYGAEAMAQREGSHEQILSWYYPGASIVSS